MKNHMTEQDITPEVKTSVRAYLLARANAEVMREAITKIETEILQESPLTDARFEHGKKITNPKDAWLADDSEWADYFMEVNTRTRKAGLKPDDMPDDHCPALVAEHIQMQAEQLILENAADMMGLEFDGKELNHKLLCLGLEKRQQFLDLVIKLVVNLPNFKNPLED